MSKISLRISKSLHAALRKKAVNSNMNLSEYVRTVLANTIIYDDQEWMLIAWKFFGINMNKLRKTLSKSLSVADFLARIDTISDKVTIMPNVTEGLNFDFSLEDKTYNVTIEPTGIISTDAERIIKRLDEKILEDFMEGI